MSPVSSPTLNGRQRRMTIYAVKVDASVISRDLQLLNYRDLGFFRVSQKLNVIVVLCRRQEQPADYFWSAVLYIPYSEVFPKSVHILVIEIPVLYQPYLAGGRELAASALVLSSSPCSRE